MAAPPLGNAIAQAEESAAVLKGPPEHKAPTNLQVGPALATKHPRIVMGAVRMATMMQMVDTTIANVALPHMQASCAAALDQISWVLTSAWRATAPSRPLLAWV